MAKSKVLLIGIDGATWDIIDPLIEQGKLPNFERLKRKGSWAKLKTLDPPLTPMVWTSIASGKVKEKHGILDFFGTSEDVQAARIWDILEENGYSIGLHEYPVTWPPRECDGFMIPDNFARDTSTYPKDLSFVKELAIGEKNSRSFGIYDRSSQLLKLQRHGTHLRTFIKAVKYFLRKRKANFSYLDDFYAKRMLKLHIYSDLFVELYKQYQLDFAVTYINQVDALGHRFWKYMDPEGFSVSQDEVKKYGDVIKNCYIAVDHQIGRLLEVTPEDTLTIILSDHGFKKTFTNPYGKSLRINIENLHKVLELPEQVVGINVHRSTYFRSKRANSNLREKELQDTVEKLKEAQLTEKGQKIYEIIEDEEWVIVKPETTVDISPTTRINGFNQKKLQYRDIIEDKAVEFSGEHGKYGVLIMKGEDVKSNYEIKEASVLDIVPTLLALLSLPIGKDMDGKVLENAIEENFLNKNPIRYIESWEGKTKKELVSSTQLGTEKEEQVKERLRDLGYL